MTAKAVLLFGSRARGDAQPRSDVDILLVTSEAHTRHVAMGTVSFYLYPWQQLLEAARSGDLFTSHISYEAKALHDPDGHLDRLRDAFRFKPSYAKEVAHASDLGWFLVHHGAGLPDAVVAKRAAWCVRTILIARAAEQRRAIFAASELVEFSGLPTVRTLIGSKDKASKAVRSLKLLLSFLDHFGNEDPIPGGNAIAYQSFFVQTHNRVAQQTIKIGDEEDSYGTIV